MVFADLFRRLPSFNELTGGIGEWITEHYADFITDGLVIRDVLIDGADGYTSQIDVVLIDNTGIYTIEVKTFPEAKIYGDTKLTKWHYYSHGKKYEIYSPIKQNAKHVMYLKTFLKDFGEIPIFSIIVMICEDFKVSGSYDGNTLICNSMPALKRGLRLFAASKPALLDDTYKKSIFDYLVSNQHQGKDARMQHKENTVAYQKHLAESKEAKRCPYCKVSLVLRNGKNGEFYGCSNFPKCRYTLRKE